jgi:hypothetical protein
MDKLTDAVPLAGGILATFEDAQGMTATVHISRESLRQLMRVPCTDRYAAADERLGRSIDREERNLRRKERRAEGW